MSFLSLPIWAIFLWTAALLFGAFEIGHLAGRVRRRRDAGDEQDERGSLVGAMIGLPGFILAIAFGAQLSRFDASKALLLDEATLQGVSTRMHSDSRRPESAHLQAIAMIYRPPSGAPVG